MTLLRVSPHKEQTALRNPTLTVRAAIAHRLDAAADEQRDQLKRLYYVRLRSSGCYHIFSPIIHCRNEVTYKPRWSKGAALLLRLDASASSDLQDLSTDIASETTGHEKHRGRSFLRSAWST